MLEILVEKFSVMRAIILEMFDFVQSSKKGKRSNIKSFKVFQQVIYMNFVNVNEIYI